MAEQDLEEITKAIKSDKGLGIMLRRVWFCGHSLNVDTSREDLKIMWFFASRVECLDIYPSYSYSTYAHPKHS